MDRRTEHRVNWSDSIQYRRSNAGDYKTGVVRDISNNGVLLWLKEDLVVGSRLEVLTGSHGKQQHVHIRVVRKGETNHEGYTDYGCKVEMRIHEGA